eukprot:9064580-Lingulodinium_polyedra.AAC.1
MPCRRGYTAALVWSGAGRPRADAPARGLCPRKPVAARAQPGLALSPFGSTHRPLHSCAAYQELRPTSPTD